MVEIRRMEFAEADRIAEIDRTEHVTLAYRMQDGWLESQPVDWRVPRWFAEGDSEHSVRAHRAGVERLLEEGGTLLGAFEGQSLVGLAVYRPQLAASMGQLGALFVSNGHRRQGIATRLAEEVERLAREDGAIELYVSATPSGSAVGFYQSRGFEPVDEPDPGLYALEPEDIHMIKRL